MEAKLTKYEMARMVGSRAPFLVKLSEEDLKKINYNPVEIAKIELENDVIPMTIRRPSPGVHKAKA